MIKISVLGITGSVGSSLLKVLRENSDQIKLVGVSAWQNIKKLNSIIAEFNPEQVAIKDNSLTKQLHAPKFNGQLLFDSQGLQEIATNTNIDILFISVTGSAGLYPLVAALKKGQTVALANKEPIVLAGKLIMSLLEEYGGQIIPLDSEHNAIAQCLRANKHKTISKIALTASGGPFLDRDTKTFPHITIKEALKHPCWEMGPKISIDSATMMNKCLEIIEARWLFKIPETKIEALIHPQSIIHGLVYYEDGSCLALLSNSDMCLPIIDCLGTTIQSKSPVQSLDLLKIGQLQFRAIDNCKFPTVNMSYQLLAMGEGAPAFINGANQALVDLFLSEKICFSDIFQYLYQSLSELQFYFANKKQAPRAIIAQNKVEDAIEADLIGQNFIMTNYKKHFS